MNLGHVVRGLAKLRAGQLAGRRAGDQETYERESAQSAADTEQARFDENKRIQLMQHAEMVRDRRAREAAAAQAPLDAANREREARVRDAVGRARALGIAVTPDMDPAHIEQLVASKQLTDKQNFERETLSILERGRNTRDMTGPGVGGAGKILPAGSASEIGDLNTLGEIATVAETSMKAAKDAGRNPTGGISGRTTWLQDALGTTSRESSSARSALANLSSTLFKMRSGAAVTPQEFERLAGFIPSDNDAEHIVEQKLKDFKIQLEIIMRNRVNALGDAGYNISRVQQRMDGSGGEFDASAWLKQQRGGRP